MAVPFMFVDGNLTLVLNNKSYQVLPDHINYRMILEILPTATPDELLKVVDLEKAVATFSDGLVEIKNGQVTYEGETVHGSISKRILEFMSKGLPFEPLVKFLHNVMENPSMQSQKELYDFLEHEHLPITEDGHFLAYKAVRRDYKDKYRGTFDNSVGNTVKMQRAKVDDDRSRGCSDGLHAGALNYVATYGSVESGDRIVIVKINPRDVVSVPTDCNCEKLRTCQYVVVGEYQGELLKPLYSSNFSYDEQDDYEDDDDYNIDESYWDQFDEDVDDEDDYNEYEDDEEDDDQY
ncbi:MAG: helix-turn-helix domain-containing protein [Chitinophagia bacterium]|nr:helix-turn-helix domain-containing protein [Chitinophagia bacterium]NCA30449.1 helix-turn-helix domain-containing protein [Chitinophagia bacterium]